MSVILALAVLVTTVNVTQLCSQCGSESGAFEWREHHSRRRAFGILTARNNSSGRS